MTDDHASDAATPETSQEGSKRGQRQAERRSRVVEAAIILAREGGYEAVQMRDVAEAADVAIGTIYRYFRSKDELLLAGMEAWAQVVSERVLAMDPPEGDVPTRISHRLRVASEALQSRPLLTAALITALASRSDTASDSRQNVGGAMSQLITVDLDGIDPADVERFMGVVNHVWFSAVVRWVGGEPDINIADELEMAVHMLLSPVALGATDAT